jgi:hypothetical protein
MWDSVISKWVSVKGNRPSIIGTDGDWMLPMGSPVTDWTYLGSPASNLSKWMLQTGAIGFAGALIAAGMKLQDKISARIGDSSGTPHWISPWYYEFDDGDTVVFSNDVGPQGGKTWNGHADLGFEPSPESIGHGAVLKSDAAGVSKLYTQGQYDDGITTSPYHSLTRQGGWDDVKFYKTSTPAGAALGGVPINTVHIPTKKFVYPTFYGIGPLASGSAAISYETRWVST